MCIRLMLELVDIYGMFVVCGLLISVTIFIMLLLMICKAHGAMFYSVMEEDVK